MAEGDDQEDDRLLERFESEMPMQCRALRLAGTIIDCAQKACVLREVDDRTVEQDRALASAELGVRVYHLDLYGLLREHHFDLPFDIVQQVNVALLAVGVDG